MPKKKRKKRKYTRRKKIPKLKLKQEIVNSVLAVCFIAIGFLVATSFTGQGKLLSLIHDFLSAKFGIAMLFAPFVFGSAGLMMLNTRWKWSKPNVLLGMVLLMLSATVLFKSGSVGVNLFDNLSSLISGFGVYILSIAFLIIGAIVLTDISLKELIEYASTFKEKRAKKSKEKEKSSIDKKVEKAKKFSIVKLKFGKKKKDVKEIEEKKQAELGDDPTGVAVNQANVDTSKHPDFNQIMSSATSLNNSSVPLVWSYPPLSLLSSNRGGDANRGDVKANAQKIEDTLESFGISARIQRVNPGPSVTQYAFKLATGTKVGRVVSLSSNLAMALAAKTGQIRIQAPIPGTSLVGVEVPNLSSQYVTLRTMLGSSLMKKQKSKLAVSLGIDVSGNPIIADIAQMPHVLIAGATGSGKSVTINSFLCSILFRASPQEVKLILIDPKRIELSDYNNIPHLLTPVIVEPKKVVSALKWATHLMVERYKQLEKIPGVKTIDQYNEHAGLASMPSIVIVVDELADIMLTARKEVEASIARLAQMARAVGIHLVVATQRPSVNVITGVIKANIPARIACKVSSVTDSRVILDTPGAEKLIGRGDMLYVSPNSSKPVRVQGTFVSNDEILNLIQYLKSQGQEPNYDIDITKFKTQKHVSGGTEPSSGGNRDVKFEEAVRMFLNKKRASSSAIQRHLQVGYARAARILDQLYEAGMVSPPAGSKPREVVQVKMQEYLDSLGGSGI